MKVTASPRAMTSIVLLLVLSSAVAGCSTPMRKTTLIADSVERDSALVNFVRPRICGPGDRSSFAAVMER